MSTRWKVTGLIVAAFGIGFGSCYLLLQQDEKELALTNSTPAVLKEEASSNYPEPVQLGQRIVLLPSNVQFAAIEKPKEPLNWESPLIYPTMPPRLVK